MAYSQTVPLRYYFWFIIFIFKSLKETDMKNKFKLLFTILFIASMIMTLSCSEDFLTKEPPGVASATQMNTKDGVEALLISTYQAT